MDKGALRDLLTSGLFLADSCPAGGVVHSEFENWLAAKVLGFNDHWPGKITSEHAVAKIARVLTDLESAGEGALPIDRFQVSVDWIRALKNRIDMHGDAALRGPWPTGDLPSEVSGARAFSPSRALERANAVYEGAARAYEEIRTALFPKFGRVLAHAATFPAILVGTFESEGVDENLGSDFGHTTINYWLRPVRDSPQSIPLLGMLGWGSRPGLAWHDEESDKDPDSSWSVFSRRRTEDPLGSAFELTSVYSSIIMNSFWGRRPATHIAVDWILHDLAELGWIEGPVVGEQLR